MVLHYQMYDYFFLTGSPDPTNGKTTTEDTWLQIGPDGTPTLIHSWETNAAGQIQQETYLTPTESVTVWEGDYTQVLPHPDSRWCAQVGPGASSAALADDLPPFADAAALSGAGYQHTGDGPPDMAPSTPQLPAVTPRMAYPRPSAVAAWQFHRDNADHSVNTTTVKVGPDRRVTLLDFRRDDPSGKVVGDTKLTMGPLFAYDTAAPIPTIVLAPPSHVTGGCK
jgi:hypothetical protein